MNQPSSACALALDSSKAASRLFRPRNALYGIVAISIAGAASAPLFVVQRAAHDKPSRQEADGSPGQRMLPALAAAQVAEPALPVAQPDPVAAAAPAASKTPPSTSAPIKRALPIPRKVAGTAFKPQKVAAWLPDPASYVARNSDADGRAPLPAIAIERSPAASKAEANVTASAAADNEASTTADTAVDTTTNIAGSTATDTAVNTTTNIAGNTATDTAVDTTTNIAGNIAADNAVATTADTTAQTAIGTATELATNTATDTATHIASDTTLASLVTSDAAQADSAGPVTIVAAASSVKGSDPVEDEHLVFHVQAGEEQGASALPAPAQATADSEEQVVIVAAAPAQRQKEQAAPVLAQAPASDVVVVSTAPNETVNLDAELRGLSLAMSTHLGAPQSKLARGPELPNWAVMGEGKKLRLSR